MNYIVHICTQDEWSAAQRAGEYRALSLKNEGFIHCSRPEQILWVANQYYPRVTDLLLLWIDPQKVAVKLLWEDSDGEVFPHLYGPLNLNAVISVTDFVPDPDGVFQVVPEPGTRKPGTRKPGTRD